MWVWIKAHKWLLAGAVALAVVLYYVYENYSGGSSSSSDSGDQLAGYGGYGGSILTGSGGGGVGYSGGGVPVSGPTSSASSAAASTPTAASSPTPSNAVTHDPSTTAQPGFTADGRPYSDPNAPIPGTPSSQLNIPIGAGWNQGTQPGATFGEGGTAVPVASGDFTHPYLREPGNPASAVAGMFVNAQGYSSKASYDFGLATRDLALSSKTTLGNNTPEQLYASGSLKPKIGATLARGLVGGSLPGGQG